MQVGLGPLSQKYILRRTREKQKSSIDYVYGVYLHKDDLMFGNKHFEVNNVNNIIIDGVRYAGTPDLYKLIFKRIPDDLTEDDMNKYKSMLLVMNAHKHKHQSHRLLSNRE